MKPLLRSSFGKYRDLVLLIALFLLIDAGVSVINIYTSHQIEADASRINAAGQMRASAQQLTKALLTLDMEIRSGAPTQSSQAEISEARLGFLDAQTNLQGKPGQVIDSGLLEAKSQSQKIQAQLAHISQTWIPIDREVGPLLLAEQLDSDAVANAVRKAVTRNNRLTQQADDLGQSLEELAQQKTATMRWIQMVAIGLAFLNFCFIVFKFIARLSASDYAAALARQENERILGGVREGLDPHQIGHIALEADVDVGRRLHVGVRLIDRRTHDRAGEVVVHPGAEVGVGHGGQGPGMLSNGQTEEQCGGVVHSHRIPR